MCSSSFPVKIAFKKACCRAGFFSQHDVDALVQSIVCFSSFSGTPLLTLVSMGSTRGGSAAMPTAGELAFQPAADPHACQR